MNPDLSVVIMAFNEQDSLEIVVKEINALLRSLARTYEIIIVDDGSYDGTGTVANNLAKKLCEIRVIHHEANKGLGGVYKTGFLHAQGDLITFFPADGQFPADIIKQFLPLMKNVDMVLGYLPERNSSLLARCLSKIERFMLRLLFGSLPRFQGLVMFKRKLLEEFTLKSSGRSWTVLMELIIRAQKGRCKIISVPTMFRKRLHGKSKVNNIPTIWANFYQMIALRRNF